MAILCYSIALEDALLDQQLRVDMKRALGKQGADVGDIDALRFYSRYPSPEAEARFQEYVKARWPIITFSVDPFRSEQNIADASSIRRDLQVALAFAFSTGQISFNQLTQFQRRIEFDAETIALNQTVNSFALDKDTFGFRFQPRYQNPPPERSNFQSLTNQLLKGGPGRNYQLNNSKLEPGQRELDVIFLMPSFLQGIRMDVTGNWFPLHDPDQMKTPTKRMIEQGRKVVELREAMACIHDHKNYRPGDVQRLTTRVLQLERMLPMQTHEIQVPYENTLGGFQLFQQGTTALVPQLDGFEGADGVAEGQETDLVIFGKHFSVQETNVIVGGIHLSTTPLDVQQSLAAASASVNAAASLTEAASQAASTSPATGSDSGSGKSAPSGGSGASSTAASATQTAAQKQASATQTVMNAAKQSVAAAQSSPSAGNANSLTGNTATAPGAIDVVSREILRVKIPAGAQTTDVYDADLKAKQTYVEVYVATPNGISNRLLVPFKPRTPATTTSSTGYTLGATSLKLNYTGPLQWNAQGNVVATPPPAQVLRFDAGTSDKKLAISLKEVVGVVPRARDATFKVTPPDGDADAAFDVTVHNITVDPKDGTYPLNVKDLADQLKAQEKFARLFQGPNASPAAAATVKLTPTSITAPGLLAEARDVAGAVTLNLKVIVTPGPADMTPEAGPGASLGSSTLKIRYEGPLVWNNHGDVVDRTGPILRFDPASSDQALTIRLHDVAGLLSPTIRVTLRITPPDGDTDAAFDLSLDAPSVGASVYSLDVDRLAVALKDRVEFARVFRGPNRGPMASSSLLAMMTVALPPGFPPLTFDAGNLSLDIKVVVSPARGNAPANTAAPAFGVPPRARVVAPRPAPAPTAPTAPNRGAAPAQADPPPLAPPAGQGGAFAPNAGAALRRDPDVGRSSYRPPADSHDLPPLPPARPRPAARPTAPRIASTAPATASADRKAAKSKAETKGTAGPKSQAPGVKDTTRRGLWPWQPR